MSPAGTICSAAAVGRPVTGDMLAAAGALAPGPGGGMVGRRLGGICARRPKPVKHTSRMSVVVFTIVSVLRFVLGIIFCRAFLVAGNQPDVAVEVLARGIGL